MQAQSQPRGLSVYDKLLVTLFLFTLPLVNPWVRGDGVGYYAFARALLVEHGLNFQQDWQRANQTFRMGRVDAGGNLTREQFTPTGRINNHFAIGAGLLRPLRP